MAKFTAKKGVHLDDLKIAFTYDADATGSSSERVYSADLSAADAKALKALPKDALAEYGIVEASKADDSKADESD